MITDILVSLATVGLIGLAAGILLAAVSHFFYVPENELAKQLRACLPGINCGACGFKGCDDYAAALAVGKTQPNLCVPGAEATSEELASILGVEAEGPAGVIAFVRCNGHCGATEKKTDYDGILTCRAASQLFGGPDACPSGCIGYGDCANACPANAICVLDGIARVDMSACLGCGLCASVCPKQLITLVPKKVSTVAMCNNRQKGTDARKSCKNACIGCKKCEKSCHEGAISVSCNLAQIDYAKCTGCGSCLEGCPTKCLHSVVFPNLTHENISKTYEKVR